VKQSRFEGKVKVNELLPFQCSSTFPQYYHHYVIMKGNQRQSFSFHIPYCHTQSLIFVRLVMSSQCSFRFALCCLWAHKWIETCIVGDPTKGKWV